MKKDDISLRSLAPYINGLHGVTLEEKGTQKLFIAVYVMKSIENGHEVLDGHFAIMLFVDKGRNPEEIAKIAENENVELALIIDVKESLFQAAMKEITKNNLSGCVSFVQ